MLEVASTTDDPELAAASAEQSTPESSVTVGAEVSVIIATLNEEAAIGECLARVLAVLPESSEVIVVDGGRDRTGDIVLALAKQCPNVRYFRNVNDRGKGHAVHQALGMAQGRILLQIDADLQFLPEEIPALLAPLLAGQADLVLGSRFATGSVRRAGSTPPLRTFGNWVTSTYASLLFGHRMTDLLAGMKAWRREVTAGIRLHCETCSYDAELPVKAVAAGFRVMDVPVTTDARHGGVSAIHVVRDGRRILWDLTRFWLRWI